MFDAAPLLAPVSAEAPSGVSFSGDPRWVKMETAAQSKPLERDASGAVVREASDGDWRTVAETALELAAGSRDVRIAMYLAPALLATEGLPGFEKGLATLAKWVTEFWPSVHPQLDPEDGNDPLTRVSAIRGLSDYGLVTSRILRAPLARSKAFGTVGWIDVARASGEALPGDPAGANEAIKDAASLDAAFSDTPAEFISEVAAAAKAAAAHVVRIESFLQANASTACAQVSLNLAPLATLLASIGEALEQELAKRAPASAAAPGAVGEAAQRAVQDGAIRTRADVAAALDRICRYYRDFEPSSPIPLILQRTKRLVNLDFLGILKELAPDGVGQFGIVAGLKDGDSDPPAQ